MAVSSKISKHRNMMLLQTSRSWDPEQDLDWSTMNSHSDLLPISQRLSSALNLTECEQTSLSQLAGLMAAQSISQHEKALEVVRNDSWSVPSQKFKMEADLRDLGEEFFHEEKKHAETFARYVAELAQRQEIRYSDLSQILPVFESQSWLTRLMRLNSLLGGRAVWWLVMLTEEESLSVFRTLKTRTEKTDPLYFNVHRLHYEEEIRHMSYAPQMLSFLKLAHAQSQFSVFVQRFDFIQMYILHIAWVISQVLRLRHLKNYHGENPFMQRLKSSYVKSRKIPFFKLVKLMYSELPWFRELLFPIRHQSIRSELNRSGSLNRILSKFLHKQWQRTIPKEHSI